MLRRSALLSHCVVLCCALFLTACGGGGGGGGTPPPANLSGAWSIDLTTLQSTVCSGRVGQVRSFDVQLSQDGERLRLIGTLGVDLTATLDGNRVTLSGTWPVDGGLAQVLGSNLLIAGDRISGEVDWAWDASGTAPCVGRDNFDARRSGSSAVLTGTWDLQETVLSASCGLSTRFFLDTWRIVQTGVRVDVTRQATGSSASGLIDSFGDVDLLFTYTDSRGNPSTEQFTVRFRTDRSPPALDASSSFQYPGCTGRSDHIGLRTGDL